jgi:hypothetical protein
MKFLIKQNKIFEELDVQRKELEKLLKLQSISPESQDQNNISTDSSNDKIRNYINIKDYYLEDSENVKKFTKILDLYKINSNLILLVDSNNMVWEILKRDDLTISSLMTPENIISYKDQLLQVNHNLLLDFICEQELEEENKSLNNSEIDLSKVSDFNMSNLIRETNNDLSDLY